MDLPHFQNKRLIYGFQFPTNNIRDLITNYSMQTQQSCTYSQSRIMLTNDRANCLLMQMHGNVTATCCFDVDHVARANFIDAHFIGGTSPMLSVAILGFPLEIVADNIGVIVTSAISYRTCTLYILINSR